MPFGEMKASDRIAMARKKSMRNIASMRHTAKTEVKFRELYDGKMPKEFKILPNPTDLFAEDKVKEEIEVLYNKKEGEQNADL